MAPTAACEVDTGRPSRVIIETVTAAATDETTAILSVNPVRPCKVSIPARPSRMAPSSTKSEAKIAAVQNFTMREDTAEPKALDASLAPRDQPRKIPPRSDSIIPAFSWS